MTPTATSSLTSLQRRIGVLVVAALATALVPIALVVLIQRELESRSSATAEFHLATVSAAEDGLLASFELGALLAPETRRPAEVTRQWRSIVNRIDRSTHRIVQLQRARGWPDAATTVARIERHRESLRNAPLGSLAAREAASHLAALHLGLQQLRLLHEREYAASAERAREGRRRLWLVLGPVLLTLLFGGAVAATLAWRAIRRAIADERRLFNTLAAAEERNRLMLELAPYGIFESDTGDRFRAMNTAGLAMLGPGARPHILGVQFRDIVAAKDQPRVAVALDRARRGHPTEFEYQAVDGREFLVHVVALPHGTLLGIAVDVTYRKQHEQRIAESHKRLKNILDSMYAFVGVFTLDGIVEEMNRAPLDAGGLQLSDVRGQPFIALPYFTELPASQAVLQDAMRRAAAGEVVRTEVVIRIQGRLLTFDSIFSPLRDERGAIVQTIGSGVDVTDRKRAEQEAAEAHQRLVSILDGMSVFAGLFTPEGVTLEMNRAGLEVAHLRRADIVGRPFTEQSVWNYSPEIQARVRAMFADAAAGRLVRQDLVVRVGDNRFITADVTFSPIHDGEGRVIQIVGSALDISERIRAENALRASEARYALVEHAVEDGIWDWNVLTGEDFLSARWKAILGYRDEELPNRDSSFFDLIHPDDVARTSAAVARHFEQHERFDIELRMRHKDGSFRWIRSRGEAIRDDAGKPVRMIGSISDFTARRAAEQALREREAQLALVFNATTEMQTLLRVEPDGRYVTEAANAALLQGLRESFPDAPVDVVGRERTEWLMDLGVPRALAEAELTHYRHAVERRTAVHYPISLPRADGVRSLEVTIAPVLDAEGACTHLLYSARDITERERITASLRENELRLKEAQALAHVGSWELDLVSGTLAWSDEIFRLFEIDPARFAASYDAFLNAIHPDDRDAVNTAYTESVRNRTDYVLAHRLLMSDGRVKWVRERGVTEYAPDGTPVRSRGTVQDITSEVLAERELRDSESRFSSAFHDNPVAMGIRRLRDGRIIEVNAALSTLLGMSREDLVGRETATLSIFPSPAQREEALAMVAHASGQSATELQLRGAHGSTRTVVISASRLTIGGEECHLTSFTDVTEQRAAEARIRESLHEKETLLREIHHRVKNNLQIISGLLHFQAKKVTDPTAAGVFVEARQRLRSMMLVHEKLYGSGNLAQVDFADYTKSLVEQLAQTSGATDGRIAFNVEAERILLPIETALPCGMVLVELVTNVVKYAFPDRKGTALVRLTQSDGHVSLSVRDDGVGLPADFNPAAATSFGWQLIGNLASQLDATVNIARDGGTAVTLTFPLAAER